MKRIAIAIAAAMGCFVLVTVWALESDGVVVAETIRPDGTVRSTHVWFVEDGSGLWLEAGTPANGWYRDILSNPELTLTIDGEARRFVAEPRQDRSGDTASDANGHDFIRARIRDKYGFRDRWVGLLVDTRESIAVRLKVPDSARPFTRSSIRPSAQPSSQPQH